MVKLAITKSNIMKITLDIKYFFGSLIALSIAFGLMTGFIQQYITFEDVLGEIGMCILAAGLGIGLLIASVEFNKPVAHGK